MDAVIYSYGGGAILAKIFNAIAMIFNSGAGQALVEVMAAIALMWVTIQAIIQHTIRPQIGWMAKYLTISMLVIYPKMDVVISDTIYHQRYKIDNVPFGLALPASLSSSLGYAMTEIIEQAFGEADNTGLAYSKYGMSFGALMLANIDRFTVQEQNFASNMESFISECVMFDVLVGTKYSVDDFRNSNDLWQLVSQNASNILTFKYREKNHLGKMVTCRAGAQMLSQQWDRDILRLASKYKNSIFATINSAGQQFTFKDFATVPTSTNSNSDIIGVKYLEANINSVLAVYGNNKSAASTLKQLMFINALSSEPLSSAGVKASLQASENWRISGEIARQVIPIAHIVFSAIIYASFIFVAGLIVLPNGQATLINYLKAILWLEFWPPLFAILNAIINFASRMAGSGISNGFTLDNAGYIISSQNTIVAVSSYLLLSVPVIAHMVMRGIASEAVGLTGSLAGALNMAATGPASEVTTGNISLDNKSLGNNSYMNNSGFKTDFNSSYRSGHHEEQLADGMLVRTGPDGETIITSGAGHTKSVGAQSINFASNMSSQAQHSYNREASSLETMQQEYAITKQQTERQASEFLRRLANGENSGSHYDFGHNTATSQAFQTFLENSEIYNKNKDVADSFAMHGNLGLSKKAGHSKIDNSTPDSWSDKIKDLYNNPSSAKNLLLSALDGGASASLSRAWTDTQSRHLSSSERSAYSDLTDLAYRAAHDIQFAETQSTEKALAESLTASYEKMTQQREALTAQYQKVESSRSSLENITSNSAGINQEMYHEFHQYVAKSTDSNGMAYGAIRAARLIDNNDPAINDLKEQFISQHFAMQSMPQTAGLMSTYQQNAANLAKAPIDYQEASSNVTAQAKMSNMAPEHPVHRQAEQQAIEMMKQTNLIDQKTQARQKQSDLKQSYKDKVRVFGENKKSEELVDD